jgi:hypothetical protein
MQKYNDNNAIYFEEDKEYATKVKESFYKKIRNQIYDTSECEKFSTLRKSKRTRNTIKRSSLPRTEKEKMAAMYEKLF